VAGFTDLELSLHGYSDRLGEARVRIETFDRAGRMRRALVGLAWCWGGALASVFIPIAHFLLVPGFAIAGVVVFSSRLRASTVIHDARGTCPDCGAEQNLDLSGRWYPPHSVTCRACQRSLTLRERVPPPGSVAHRPPEN